MSRFKAMVLSGTLTPTPLSAINWDTIGFGGIVTPFVGGSVALSDGIFEPVSVVPNGAIAMPPLACCLNYGQELFEGMKAQRGPDGKIRMFRIEANAQRMAKGAARFMLSPPPQELYRQAVIATVKANADYVPPYGKGSLYVRPILAGVGMTLSPAPSDTTLFLVTCLPVGLHYKGSAMINVKVETEFQRAAAKGTGWVKAAGNYAPCFLPSYEAKHQGYDDLLFLNQTGSHVEEVGTANFAVVKNGVLYAADSPSILPGITRDSVMRIAREILHMDVVFGPLELDRVLGLGAYAHEGPADEAFFTGTAAVISPISKIHYRGKDYTFGDTPGPFATQLRDQLVGIQTGRYPDPFGWVTEVD
jgi:branched-chain amino acid aminotransferase